TTEGRSLYGAPWLQPMAISGKSGQRGSGGNKRNRHDHPVLAGQASLEPVGVVPLRLRQERVETVTAGDLRLDGRRTTTPRSAGAAGTHVRRSEGATSARIPRGQGASVLLSR